MPGKTLGERITMAEQHDTPAPAPSERCAVCGGNGYLYDIAALRALLVRAERWIDDVDHQDLNLLDDIRDALGVSHE